MSLTLTVTDHWQDGKRIHVVGTIVAAGNYTTAGVTLSFADTKIKSSSIPEVVLIAGANGLYIYRYQPGTGIADGKVLVVDLSTQAQLAAAAFPAGITGDTLTVYAIFPKFI